MDDLHPAAERDLRVRALKLGLLAVWALVTFGAAWFARALDFTVFGWPFGYWFAAQGSIITFVAIVVVYAWAMNRLSPDDAIPRGGDDAV